MDTKVADPLRGALLGGRYRIMGRLARGGTTTVYQARDERLDRSVAIRIINPEHVLDAEVIDRLAREAQTVAHLAHPNIVTIYDQGSHEGAPFLVMEYVRGRTLREVVAERGRLDPAESLALVEQLLAALAVAHRNGLVHRAIRPENVLVAPPPSGSGDLIDAVVKVADFGLASHTPSVDLGRSQAGPLFAAAPYLAPELITEGRADTRADVYAVGVVLFEMLTGRLPFPVDRRTADTARYPGGLDVDEPPEVPAWRHIDEEVPPPSQYADAIPTQLDGIAFRATRRDPNARQRDAAAMLAQIQSAREEVGALAGPTRMIAHPTVVVPVVPGDEHRSGRPRPPGPRPTGRAAPGARADAPPGVGNQVRAAVAAGGGWLRVMGNRLRYTTRGRRQLMAIVAVVGLGLVVGGWWLGAGRYVEAPDLRQMTMDNAIAEAQRQGFSVVIGAPIFSEDVPADTVLSQSPLPGGRILRGGTITLYLSQGPERYAVPDITGQEFEFAITRIPVQLLYTQTDGFSDTLPVGYVAGTDPPAGTILAPGDSITVVVVKGPFPVHVPPVVGQLLADAQARLNQAGFRDIEVQRRDDNRRRDTVLEQTPAAGTGLPSASGQKITLVVSNGPALAMPNLVTQNCLGAAAQLQGLGVAPTVNGAPPGPSVPLDWTVTGQSVGEGEALTPGQPVNLTCEPPPPPPPPPGS